MLVGLSPTTVLTQEPKLTAISISYRVVSISGLPPKAECSGGRFVSLSIDGLSRLMFGTSVDHRMCHCPWISLHGFSCSPSRFRSRN